MDPTAVATALVVPAARLPAAAALPAATAPAASVSDCETRRERRRTELATDLATTGMGHRGEQPSDAAMSKVLSRGRVAV